MDDYLTKPVNIGLLREKLAHWALAAEPATAQDEYSQGGALYAQGDD